MLMPGEVWFWISIPRPSSVPLHQISSHNPLGSNTNNKISFLPFIYFKDFFFFFFLGILGFLEIFFGFISLSHPDNAFEVSVLVTPLHIVPEWYFLEFYAILKAVPNKNAGFMIMFSSIFCVFIFGEPKGLSRLLLSPIFTGHYSVSLIFFLGFYFLWTGAQLPQEKFISYGRFFVPLASYALLGSSLNHYSFTLFPFNSWNILSSIGSGLTLFAMLFFTWNP